MSLHLVENVRKIKIPLKAIDKDVLEVMDPLYDREKIYDKPIMNVEIGCKENYDIDHQARDVVE